MNTSVVTRVFQLQSQERTPDPDLHIVVLFCLIGLLLTFCLALRVPEFEAALRQFVMS